MLGLLIVDRACDIVPGMRIVLVFLLSLLVSSPIVAKNPIVLELFTSPLCPFCPPADALMRDIVREDESLITMTCSVAVESASGWRNPVGQSFCNKRHQFYFTQLGLRTVYTPLSVMNGVFDNNGAREKILRSALAMGKAEPLVAGFPLEVEDGLVQFFLPAIEVEEDVDLWLFSLEDSVRLTVDAGAVPAPQIVYPNLVKQQVKLSSWDGAPNDFSLPLQDIKGDSYVVLAQARDGRILAAAKTRHNPMSVPVDP